MSGRRLVPISLLCVKKLGVVLSVFFQNKGSPEVSKHSSHDASSSLMTRSTSQDTMTFHRGLNNSSARLNGDRSRSVGDQSPTLRVNLSRSHSVNDVCVKVNTWTSPIGGGDVGNPSSRGRNDLKNILFLAEPNSDSYNSASCTEDDESSVTSGSDFDCPSASYNREDRDGESCRTETVVMTDKLRQLASSTHTVQKINSEPNRRHSLPTADPCADDVIEEKKEELPTDSREENSVDSACSENVAPSTHNVQKINGEPSRLQSLPTVLVVDPPADGVVQEEKEELPKDSREANSVEGTCSENVKTASSENVGVSSQTADSDHTGVSYQTTNSDNSGVSSQTTNSDNAGVSYQTTNNDNTGVSSETANSDNIGVSSHTTDSDNTGVSSETTSSDHTVVSSETANSDHIGVSYHTTDSDNAGVSGETTSNDNSGVSGQTTNSDNTGVSYQTKDSDNAGVSSVTANIDRTGDAVSCQTTDSDCAVVSSETANSDDAEVSSLGASDGEKLVPELQLITNLSESQVETEACEPTFSPSCLEHTDDADGIERSSNLTVTMASDREETSDVSLGTLPASYVKRYALECERRLSASACSGSNTVSAKSRERLASVDSARGDMRKSLASSGSQRSSIESSVSSMQDIGVEEEFYSNAELDAAMTETKDPEVILEQRDSVGSLDEELWPGHEPNYVFRLARAYSSRLKEMKASPSTRRRGRISTLKQKSTDKTPNKNSPSSSLLSRFLPTRKYEVSSVMSSAAEPEDSGSYEKISSWNGSQSKSVDATSTFPHTNVREAIRKLKQKASSSNTACPHRQSSRLFSPASESVNRPSLNTVDNPQQCVGAAVSQLPLVPRQPGSLVQERVRMLHGGGGFS